MYCVFCGKTDVTSCSRCGRWVCPRHRQAWGSRTVCVGCVRILIRVRIMQAAVFLVALGLIGLTVMWAFAE
jgi:hypothetical protein